MSFYLPETGPRFIRLYHFCELANGEMEMVTWGRIREKFAPNNENYVYTDAVHLAPPNPDRRSEYLEKYNPQIKENIL